MMLEALGWGTDTQDVHVTYHLIHSRFTRTLSVHHSDSPCSQFTWARNPNWSAYYSSSKEIWQYFKDVATKFNLEKYVKLNTTVESATWNEEKGQWILSLTGADGEHYEDYCEILVNGSGVLKYVHHYVTSITLTSPQLLEIPRHSRH